MTADVDKRCVLVVDDEPGVRESWVEVVEMVGCQAITAADGVEALALLATRRPCLIVLDLVMPRMSGLEVLDELRKRPELAALPVVVSTSAPHLAPPGVPILVKPIQLKAAWEWIQRCCECDDAGLPLNACEPSGN